MARKRGAAKRPLWGLGKVGARQTHRLANRHSGNLRGKPFRSVSTLWHAQERTARSVARRAIGGLP